MTVFVTLAGLSSRVNGADGRVLRVSGKQEARGWGTGAHLGCGGELTLQIFILPPQGLQLIYHFLIGVLHLEDFSTKRPGAFLRSFQLSLTLVQFLLPLRKDLGDDTGTREQQGGTREQQGGPGHLGEPRKIKAVCQQCQAFTLPSWGPKKQGGPCSRSRAPDSDVPTGHLLYS